MKLVLMLSIVFSFWILNAQDTNSTDPNLQIGMDSTFEADLADTTGIHQNAQRSYAVVPSATCPACAHFPNLTVDAPSSELNGVRPTGSTSADDSSKDPNQR
jgi:hypothetical protein